MTAHSFTPSDLLKSEQPLYEAALQCARDYAKAMTAGAPCEDERAQFIADSDYLHSVIQMRGQLLPNPDKFREIILAEVDYKADGEAAAPSSPEIENSLATSVQTFRAMLSNTNLGGYALAVWATPAQVKKAMRGIAHKAVKIGGMNLSKIGPLLNQAGATIVITDVDTVGEMERTALMSVLSDPTESKVVLVQKTKLESPLENRIINIRLAD